MPHRYVLALGANIYRKGPPARTIDRALAALEVQGVALLARSQTIASQPLGPGRRDFANAAAFVESDLLPPAILELAKRIERNFGRRTGRRWGDRVLDIDVVLWSGGIWARDGLVIPHPAFRERGFVLGALAEIVPGWRDPISGLSMRQLWRRLRRNSPVDRTSARP